MRTLHSPALLGQLIPQTKLIDWTKAPMTDRHAFGAFDKRLKDIMRNIMRTIDLALEQGTSIWLNGDCFSR
jgi:hypothetical protein